MPVSVGDRLTPNDISGLRRPKSVKFGTKVAFNTRMMRALGFLESFLIVEKFAKNRPKMTKMSTFFSTLSQKPIIAEM